MAVGPEGPIAAITKVLDMTYWYMPENRTQAIEDAVTQRTQSARKRQKLAGVGGGSGSTPRTKTPTSESDVRQAMIDEVARDWFGQPATTE
jgi:hypothetical protein